MNPEPQTPTQWPHGEGARRSGRGRIHVPESGTESRLAASRDPPGARASCLSAGFRVVAVPPPALAWLEERTGVVLTRQARGIAAVDGQGRVRGMVAYDNWTENSVQCHMATETPVAWRALTRPAFEYPFVQAGRGVIVGLIRAGNTPSLRMATALGFEVLQRIRDGASVGEDLVVIQMRRESCRWLAHGRPERRRRHVSLSVPLAGGSV